MAIGQVPPSQSFDCHLGALASSQASNQKGITDLRDWHAQKRRAIYAVLDAQVNLMWRSHSADFLQPVTCIRVAPITNVAWTSSQRYSGWDCAAALHYRWQPCSHPNGGQRVAGVQYRSCSSSQPTANYLTNRCQRLLVWLRLCRTRMCIRRHAYAALFVGTPVSIRKVFKLRNL